MTFASVFFHEKRVLYSCTTRQLTKNLIYQFIKVNFAVKHTKLWQTSDFISASHQSTSIKTTCCSFLQEFIIDENEILNKSCTPTDKPSNANTNETWSLLIVASMRSADEWRVNEDAGFLSSTHFVFQPQKTNNQS